MTDSTTLLLGPRVAQHTCGGSRAWALALDVPDVVSFSGSLVTGIDLATSQRVMERFVARMLDRGSTVRDRFEIAEWLESRGAQLGFGSEAGRISFSGRALRNDVREVVALAAELLSQPAFDDDEVEKVRRELDASIRLSRADTGFLADAALSRCVYAPRHPGYRTPLDEKAHALAAVTRDQLVDLHRRRVAPRSVLLAVVGDLSGVEVPSLLDAFPQAEALSLPPTPPVERAVAGRTRIDVADKPNLDVRLGHGLALTRQDADFMPMHVGVYALGGNFSARLMQEVRDRQGLTYGIRAAMEYVDTDQQGHLGVRATFSTQDLERGITATRAVVNQWRADGLDAAEFERVRETLLGTYDVGLSTTGALASRMLTRAEQGFTPDYLDAYRGELRAVTRAHVNAAIRRHVDLDALHLTSAGVHPAA